MLLTATAIVAEHASDDHSRIDDVDPDERQQAMLDAVRQASGSTMPYLARYAEDVVGGSPHECWDWWVRCEISAITHADPPPPANTTDRHP